MATVTRRRGRLARRPTKRQIRRGASGGKPLSKRGGCGEAIYCREGKKVEVGRNRKSRFLRDLVRATSANGSQCRLLEKGPTTPARTQFRYREAWLQAEVSWNRLLQRWATTFGCATSPRRTVTSSVVSCQVFAPRFSTQEMAVALKPVGSTFLTLAGRGSPPRRTGHAPPRPNFRKCKASLFINSGRPFFAGR